MDIKEIIERRWWVYCHNMEEVLSVHKHVKKMFPQKRFFDINHIKETKPSYISTRRQHTECGYYLRYFPISPDNDDPYFIGEIRNSKDLPDGSIFETPSKLTEMKSKNFTLTREQLATLHGQFNCSEWRDYILAIASMAKPLDTHITITDDHISYLIAHGTNKQKEAVRALGIPVTHKIIKTGFTDFVTNTRQFNDKVFGNHIFSVNQIASNGDIVTYQSFEINPNYHIILDIINNVQFFTFKRKDTTSK